MPHRRHLSYVAIVTMDIRLCHFVEAVSSNTSQAASHCQLGLGAFHLQSLLTVALSEVLGVVDRARFKLSPA